MTHMYAYLMGTSRLQSALNERHVREALQHPPVSHGFFGIRILLRIPDAIDGAVSIITSQCTKNRARVLLEGTPNECVIRAIYGMFEELPAQVGLGFGCLSDE